MIAPGLLPSLFPFPFHLVTQTQAFLTQPCPSTALLPSLSRSASPLLITPINIFNISHLSVCSPFLSFFSFTSIWVIYNTKMILIHFLPEGVFNQLFFCKAKIIDILLCYCLNHAYQSRDNLTVQAA